MPTSSQIQYISQRAQQLGLDPKAVLAIAGHEGLSGGIGDGGHAFGAFQLNNAGGVLTGKFSGKTPQQINQWAWSPAGIDYALSGISKVAGGLKGNAAIQAIATKFERPADPAAEIADAESRYGHVASGLAAPSGASPVPNQGMTSPLSSSPQSTVNAGGSQSRQQLAALVFGGMGGTNFNSNQVQAPNLMALAQARQELGSTPSPTGSTPQATTQPTPAPKLGGITPGGNVRLVGDAQGLNSSFVSKVTAAAHAAGATQIRITSGYRAPDHNAAVGGVQNSNHLTGHALDGDAFIPGKGWVPLGQALLPVVGKFGLRSGDVAGFFNGGTDPVHVDDGWNVNHG